MQCGRASIISEARPCYDENISLLLLLRFRRPPSHAGWDAMWNGCGSSPPPSVDRLRGLPSCAEKKCFSPLQKRLFFQPFPYPFVASMTKLISINLYHFYKTTQAQKYTLFMCEIVMNFFIKLSRYRDGANSKVRPCPV